MTSSSITLADVASQAGVSKMTVSKVINKKPGISETTRQRVMQAVDELGYTVHASARALAGGRTHTLGVVVSSLDSQYFSELMRGADMTARDAGLELLISTTRASHEHRNIGRLAHGLVDGLLMVFPASLAPYERSLRALSLPVVVIAPGTQASAEQQHFPSVDADHYSGARQAMQHLLSLGHRRIAFIGGPPHLTPSRERLRGYREGLLTASIAPDAALQVTSDFSQRSGFQAARELLALAERPTAIFALNDVSAFGAIEAIKDAGLRVPEDISVIGFDNIPQASQVFPALTTIEQPLLEMGAAGTRQLLNLIQGVGAVTDRLIVPTELIIRASTGPLLSVDRRM
ncbi:LacI family DNA-binding transcriptional regulator [Deinococcus alpinitundrae]|uniref:LacI family DNA-binding transcriptional regulator n=1 Tax=Deinococcus alpinitundrae TaxID=468913 RepID=UPI001379B4A7|nr:LacI family DNA-binding transcriptional regulator [Deinococcus alpinitundrae]